MTSSLSLLREPRVRPAGLPCADLQIRSRRLAPHPLEHLSPMLLPILSQIEQKALVERSARSLRRAARLLNSQNRKSPYRGSSAELLVSWGPLVIAAPLAGSLLTIASFAPSK